MHNSFKVQLLIVGVRAVNDDLSLAQVDVEHVTNYKHEHVPAPYDPHVTYNDHYYKNLLSNYAD